MQNDYEKFLNKKRLSIQYNGIQIDRNELHPVLFEYQKDLVKWALRKGKAALFTMTGTGKTLCEIEFCRQLWLKKRYNCLIITPLAVSEQTIREAREKMDVVINNVRKNSFKEGINIVNYEYLHKIDFNNYQVIVLDESGILKSYSGKTRNNIISMFKNYKFKLAATATPAPNDYEELGNHSEFLDILKRKEMLSMFFNHDSGNTSKWKLKRHAIDKYWEWVASWGAVMNHPSDFGYEDNNFILPKLNENMIKLKNNNLQLNGKKGFLVNYEFRTLSDRRKARRNSLNKKIEWIKNKVNENKNDIFLIWCDLNYESEMIRKNIPECVEIKGSDSNDYKEKTMLDFSKGKIRILVTKPKIAGHGMNWQICHNQIFCGLSDSFENYFQAVRRSWRFGQSNIVNIYVLYSIGEKLIIDNIKKKEIRFNRMYKMMKDNTIKHVLYNIKNKDKKIHNFNKDMILPDWYLSN